MAAATNGAQKRRKIYDDGHSSRGALCYFIGYSIVGSELIPDLDYVPSLAAPSTAAQSLTGVFPFSFLVSDVLNRTYGQKVALSIMN